MSSLLSSVPSRSMVFLLMILTPLSATAHHGLGSYDQSNVLTLKGKVVGFELRDPHSLLFVEVANPDGSATVWAIEGGAARGIVETGLSREFLSGGPMVTVTALPSVDSRCEPLCRAAGQNFDFER
ncbi:DUF6152 family protein [Pseudohongiella sp. SYSU M77423]|uniref:DUF6152 family protein n=1 Tax=Pseudohongiella sp. SYSU M77423 TaxID=3042312 RepID=UPI00248114D7|nr:DUF6152 family protein [Pseudohongiella sp. SYSU M77423]MDH7943373.1 DUF6152 family protein [Pseudohongiella sp. SYSU M77423]